MIGILLVSHGKMAEGIKDSVGMIVGQPAQFDTLALIPGQNIDDLKNSILDKSKQLNQGEGVLIFVDLYGASPYNASMKCLPDWQALNIDARVITGMSLPMVITAVCNRDSSTLYDLAQEAIESGQESIQDAIAALTNTNQTTESDDY
ncbi:PTS sugar transporter subunit IIA [Orbaceae bacterium ESL0727]|nr:PTS sugar transporter subunit IIA [Orbaceae bacterium ESL0727]